MLDDIKGPHLEEFSALVMRRWVLMIRLLERCEKLCNKGVGEGKTSELVRVVAPPLAT